MSSQNRAIANLLSAKFKSFDDLKSFSSERDAHEEVVRSLAQKEKALKKKRKKVLQDRLEGSNALQRVRALEKELKELSNQHNVTIEKGNGEITVLVKNVCKKQLASKYLSLLEAVTAAATSDAQQETSAATSSVSVARYHVWKDISESAGPFTHIVLKKDLSLLAVNHEKVKKWRELALSKLHEKLPDPSAFAELIRFDVFEAFQWVIGETVERYQYHFLNQKFETGTSRPDRPEWSFEYIANELPSVIERALSSLPEALVINKVQLTPAHFVLCVVRLLLIGTAREKVRAISVISINQTRPAYIRHVGRELLFSIRRFREICEPFSGWSTLPADNHQLCALLSSAIDKDLTIPIEQVLLEPLFELPTHSEAGEVRNKDCEWLNSEAEWYEHRVKDAVQRLMSSPPADIRNLSQWGLVRGSLEEPMHDGVDEKEEELDFGDIDQHATSFVETIESLLKQVETMITSIPVSQLRLMVAHRLQRSIILDTVLSSLVPASSTIADEISTKISSTKNAIVGLAAGAVQSTGESQAQSVDKVYRELRLWHVLSSLRTRLTDWNEGQECYVALRYAEKVVVEVLGDTNRVEYVPLLSSDDIDALPSDLQVRVLLELKLRSLVDQPNACVLADVDGGWYESYISNLQDAENKCAQNVSSLLCRVFDTEMVSSPSSAVSHLRVSLSTTCRYALRGAHSVAYGRLLKNILATLDDVCIHQLFGKSFFLSTAEKLIQKAKPVPFSTICLVWDALPSLVRDTILHRQPNLDPYLSIGFFCPKLKEVMQLRSWWRSDKDVPGGISSDVANVSNLQGLRHQLSLSTLKDDSISKVLDALQKEDEIELETSLM